MFTCTHVYNTCVHVVRLLKQEGNVTNPLLVRSFQCTGLSVILKRPG